MFETLCDTQAATADKTLPHHGVNMLIRWEKIFTIFWATLPIAEKKSPTQK